MKRLVIVLSCVQLSGCFFLYIPGSVFQSGDTCVPTTAYVGQRIKNEQNGKVGTVKELHGPSDRCNTTYPFIATVDYS